VELDKPVNWQEGMRVCVVPQEESLGPAEQDWPDNPAALAEILHRIDTFEPLELTPEDEAEIAAARAAVRDVTLRAVRKKMGL